MTKEILAANVENKSESQRMVPFKSPPKVEIVVSSVIFEM